MTTFRLGKDIASVLLISVLLVTTTICYTEATGNKAVDTCQSPITVPKPNKLRNSAFVFIKPHANNLKVYDLVTEKLESEGIDIISQVSIGGEEIDSKGLIDQHYYSIASKATILPPDEIPVPRKLFQETFGEEWEKVLEEGRASNALEACNRFKCSPEELNEAWRRATAVKFGGGFYCGTKRVTLLLSKGT